MDDSSVVGGAQAFGHGARDLHGSPCGEGLTTELLPERLAFQQLHDQVGTAFVGADVKEGHQVRVVQTAYGTCLVLEAPEPVSISREGRWQHFDGHIASQPGIPSAVYLTHASCANRREDFVRT